MYSPVLFRYLLLIFLLLPYPAMAVVPGSQSPVTFNRNSFQVPFISNDGQIKSEVAFYTLTSNGTVYVQKDGGIAYAMKGGRNFVLTESFIGGRKSTVAGGVRSDTLVNYYSGSDPAKWREAVSTFLSLELGRKYELIDVCLTVAQGTVEKIFTVHPGGNVANIRSRVTNAKSLEIDRSGRLLVLSSCGTIQFTEPVAYQVKDGKRSEVDVSYLIHGSDYGFVVGDYDRTLPLYIDPLLASTYMGGKSNETIYAMEIYGGDIILGGTADSKDFPGLDGKIDALGDAFVVRLDPDLSTVRAATYFGGSMTEGVRAMAVGGGAIYAAGFNNSPNFPTTPGAAYAGSSLSGAFIVKMDPDTLRITSSTSFHANVFGLAWSQTAEEVYVAGSTGDTGIPIPGDNFPAFQQTHKGGADGFVAALDKELMTLKGATLLGGEGFDIIYDLTVDERGYPIAVGVTNSAAFPVSKNAFGPAYNLDWEANHQWIDGFVARFRPDLIDLESATYLGGGLIDNITTVAAEGSLVLVGGNTASADFPCGSTFGPVDGNDAFVVLLNEDLSRMRSCTVFGGSRPGTDSPESVSDVAFHPSGAIFAVGRTNASDFPTTPGAFYSHPSGSYFGAFIISFNRDMSVVEASTLVHGNSEDLKAVAFDSWGDVFVAGDSSGSSYPVTPGALQTAYMGGDDLVISRFTPDLAGPHLEILPDLLDFGRVSLGTEGFEELLIHNTGGSDLVIKNVELTPGSSPAFAFENSCFTIPAFNSCSIEVGFKPVSTASGRGELVVYSNDHFRGEATVGLKGSAVKKAVTNRSENTGIISKKSFIPHIKAEPDPCIFGDVQKGDDLSRTIRITNEGDGDLRLNQVGIEPEGKGPFVIGEDTCSGVVLEVDPGKPGHLSSCEVKIVFMPEAMEESEASLMLVSNDPAFPVYPVILRGTGTKSNRLKYPGFWGWIAILVLVLRMVLGLPATAGGWMKWKSSSNSRK